MDLIIIELKDIFIYPSRCLGPAAPGCTFWLF